MSNSKFKNQKTYVIRDVFSEGWKCLCGFWKLLRPFMGSGLQQFRIFKKYFSLAFGS